MRLAVGMLTRSSPRIGAGVPLNHSNDTARLADERGARLCAPMEDPLSPLRVLVPQAGLKRWLQVYLAEKLGVLANIAFTPPAEFAWELLRTARALPAPTYRLAAAPVPSKRRDAQRGAAFQFGEKPGLSGAARC